MKLRALALSVLMVMSVLAVGVSLGPGVAAAANDAGNVTASDLNGTGTSEDPYQIENWYHLDYINDELDAHYTLVANLNESTDGYDSVANASANGDKGFAPIGDYSTPFNGTFDGQGHTIANLTINRSSETYVGLFSAAGSSSLVTNTKLDNVEVNGGQNNIGGVAGLTTGSISNVTVTGTVNGTNIVGGVTGDLHGSIAESTSTANVTGQGGVGGLVGGDLVDGESFTVIDSTASGNVSGTSWVGGLVGIQKGGTLERSTATGSVEGEQQVGGLAGLTKTVDINHATATGNVTGSSIIGGLVGSNGWEEYNLPGGTIENSTASGNVTVNESATAPTQFGGLVGQNYKGTVITSNALGDVQAGDATSVGGLVGYTDATGTSDVVNESYATGNVTGAESVGGLAGTVINATVNQTYATGTVSGDTEIGGLVGNATGANTEVSQSYAVGSVSATGTPVGGLVGTTQDSATVTDAYWDTETTGVSSSGPGTGLTTSQMIGLDALGSGNMEAFESPPWETVSDGSPSVADADGYPILQALAAEPQIHTPSVESGAENLYAGGTGTESDPYEIANWTHLNNTRQNLDSNFELVADLNESTDGYSDVHDAQKGFAPIGNATPFTGTFDGNGYTIADLTIDRPSEDEVGLFGDTGSSAEIAKANLVDVNVTGSSSVGGLVGFNGGTVNASNATGNVTGTQDIGGLVGYIQGGAVNNSGATAAVNGSSKVGGLIGTIGGGETANAFANGNVTGSSRVGGLVGNIWSGTVRTSSATGNVTGSDSYVGGLVGWNEGTVKTSSATGNVTGSGSLGGFVGFNMGTVKTSSATGTVNGTGEVGGLVGANVEGTVNSSYATGDAAGSSSVGGLVGGNTDTVKNSYAVGDVTGSDDVGGLVGSNDEGTVVTRSNATGEVNGSNQVGGLVGDNRGTVTTSYATGGVNATGDNVGGLIGRSSDILYVGDLYNATVTNTYATGTVSSDGANVGGLVGNNSVTDGGTSVVNRSYAAGAVSGNSNDGGLVGVNAGTVTDAYWDVNTTGQDTSASGTGLTTSQLKGNESLVGFDFTNTWGVVSGTEVSYPYLLNNTQSPAPGLESIFPGGDGTEANPYQIADWNDLDNVRNALDANYTLVADLDENTAGYSDVHNAQKGFAPIGADYDTPFTGTFDGQAHTITNLTIERASENYVGLFGYAGSNAEIANTSLESVTVTGNDQVGGLVGEIEGGTITESTVAGTVTGSEKVGGLVGFNDDSTVTDSTASGTVNGSKQVGGLVGHNYGPMTNVTGSAAVNGTTEVGGLVGNADINSITNAVATGDVTGETGVGGAVGRADDIKGSESLENITATGSVDGTTRVGGLLGNSGDGESYILDSSARGDVFGNDFVGGLVGHQGNIKDSTASGAVTGKDYVGGLVGFGWHIEGSTASGTVAGNDSVGGLSGVATGRIIQSSSSGGVTGETAVGGLVGTFEGMRILTSYSTGDVDGDTRVGGFIGDNAPTRGFEIRNSYTTGNVSGDIEVGGFVGNHTGLPIEGSYAIGTVTGNSAVGGFAGYSQSPVRGGYWDVDATNQSNSDGGTDLTTGELTGYSAPHTTALDFTSTWAVVTDGGNASYPYLQANPEDPRPGLRTLYAGGNGTTSNPYKIANWTHLDNVRENPRANFTLVEDLDSTKDYGDVHDAQKGFAPIGDSSTPFTGTFDGNDSTIADLTINRSGDNDIGLFGYAGDGAVITNVTLESVTVNGSARVGALVGNMGEANVTGTTASGTVNGAHSMGGLIGENNGFVSASNATVTVTGSGSAGGRGVGGLVGTNQNGGLIIRSQAHGNVTTERFGGGLVGSNANGTVNRSRATGTVTGNILVGGLVGANGDPNGNSGVVTESNATGTVTGTSNVGGLVGYNSVGSVSSSYATGNVSADSAVGGLIGGNTDSVTASNASGAVTGKQGVGGLVGANGDRSQGGGLPGGTIETSTASGTVTVNESATAPTQFGGLVGQNYKGTVTTSNATGDVLAGDATDVGGLIGYNDVTQQSTIRETHAIGDVTGSSNVGGLIGTNIDDLVADSYATGNVTGSSNVGGLVGANGNASEFQPGGTIETSTASGTITLAGDSTDPENMGGLVGQSFQGTVMQSNATGDVNGGDATNVGGLVGYNDATEPKTIRETHATGAVDGGNNVGGLVGTNKNDLVTESYAIGSVNGSVSVGGLVGNNTGTLATVNDSYAAGLVSGDSAGGLVGTIENGASVTDAYWDVNTTGQDTSAGTATGLTTTQLKANTSLDGFDFDTTWHVLTGVERSYPYLLNNTQSPAPGLESLFAGGDGTEADPYELSSPDTLGSVSSAPNASYELTADLDMDGVSHDPIGTAATPFNGSFDGNGYTIANLTIDRPGEDNVGLFGHVGTNGTVANVTIEDATVTGDSNVGGLVGENIGTITGSSVTGSVTGNESVGGLAGANGVESDETPGGTIESSTASATVTVNESATAPTQFGGLVGQNYQGTVTTSNATGDVLAGDATSVGGLVGYTNGTGASAVVNVSYATGNVTGNERVGGVAGTVIDATVNQTYAMGSVTGDTAVGGLVGNATGSNTDVLQSYAAGNVTGNSSVGGFVGTTTDSPRVANSYWDVVATGQDESAKLSSWAGRTTAEMTGYSAPAVLTSFDIAPDGTWDVLVTNGQASYPTLQANPQIPRPGTRTLYAAGDGTAGNPYEIENWNQLNATRENPRANYTLVADLDSETVGYDSVASASANGGDGFAPIGTLRRGFEGEFDGEGHTIANLTIDRPDEDTVGLFGVVPAGQYADGTVKNLRLSNVDITGGTSVGGVAGFHGQAVATIANVSVSGTVEGTEDVGGVVGTNLGLVEHLNTTATVNGSTNVGGLAGANGGIVTESYAVGTVTGSTNVGGLVGANELGTVRDSYAMGDVTGDSTVGGLLGTNNGGLVTESYGTGNVTVSGDNAGGLIGWNTDYADWSGVHNATVTNTYATGDVSAKGGNVGGLVGNNTVTDGGQSVINNSYAAGTVSGDTNLGGLVGTNNATVENGYWDTETTGLSDSDGGIGFTTSQLKANTSLAGFDFNNTWAVVADDEVSYPYLLNNTQSPAPGLETPDVEDPVDGGSSGGGSGTVDMSAPSISGFEVTNPSGQDIRIVFDASEQVSTISASITGVENDTLTTGDFSETDNGDGTYTYIATYAGSSDGTYTATLDTAEDDAGNDGASGQSESVTIDVTAPSISGFEVTNPSERDIRVAFDTDEQLATVEVSMTGAENTTLTESDFAETDNGDGTYTYEATYAGSTDGNYTATLETATDALGNDGANAHSETAIVDTTAPSISGLNTTNTAGQDVRVAFDASEQLSTIDVSITGAESASLTESDFTETDNGDGTYTYEATHAGNTDGTYEATLETATDTADNDGASGQSATVQVDTDDEDDGDTTTDEDDGDTTTDEDDGDTTTDEDDGDTTTDEDDGDTTTDEDDGDTTTDEDDGDTTTDDVRKPSGDTTPGETWVEPSELQEVRIVDVRLETEPANSVKTTNIITLENPSSTERSVDVRFVINGEVVGEREVSVPAEQRINATQSEIVEKPGTHEVAANVATNTDDGGTVRTFDFMIGTLELDDNGDELASASADPPEQRVQDDVTPEDETDEDGGLFSPFVWVGAVVLVLLALVGVYVRRRNES